MPSFSGINARARKGEKTIVLSDGEMTKDLTSLVQKQLISADAIQKLAKSGSNVAIITSFVNGEERIVSIRAARQKGRRLS